MHLPQPLQPVQPSSGICCKCFNQFNGSNASAAAVHCNAQGRAAKGTLEKCTNDQLKSWLRAKVGGLLGAAAGVLLLPPVVAPPVRSARQGGLSGNSTSWNGCGTPRFLRMGVERLQGMHITVWHRVHRPLPTAAVQGLKLTGNKKELVARIQLHLGIGP